MVRDISVRGKDPRHIDIQRYLVDAIATTFNGDTYMYVISVVCILSRRCRKRIDILTQSYRYATGTLVSSENLRWGEQILAERRPQALSGAQSCASSHPPRSSSMRGRSRPSNSCRTGCKSIAHLPDLVQSYPISSRDGSQSQGWQVPKTLPKWWVYAASCSPEVVPLNTKMLHCSNAKKRKSQRPPLALL